MNSGFVNRLVGTSIIVIAAIVFIPNILDGEKVHYKEGFQQIPERPEFKSIDLQKPIDARAQLAPEPKTEVVEEVIADDIDTQIPVDSTADSASVDSALESQTIAKSKDTDTNAVTKPSDNRSEQSPAPKAEQPMTEQVNKPKQAVTVETKEPKLARSEDSNFSKMAYVIQLGSFSHKANVDALIAKLKLNGFKTFTRPVKTPNGTLTKVFVGPDLNKQKLEAKLPELKKLTKLNGRLTQFKVAN
ncbi:SPOR domain-containing protein [Pseudoalteromonas obscura]|uniref:SPOR domain-containing protein n=1 Tax=Pseudoalteromonas obscura TaxID=3048491 RepID=A0ABT7EI88_9GAMM|nr:SPOR domain-containing protein [Pseudoalteromonas sp. P94(2023)]MDK2594755.1 SPOR domain-containing protein [Pseudoalteromonas sp. P94(2023)]